MVGAVAKRVGHLNGAFDDHNPPSLDLIQDCVHCGFCLPACPTYALWGEEMDSPRGRIYLMKLGVEREAGMTDTFVRHFDLCLSCMSCVTACPSGVQYGKLIEATRAQIERRYPRSLPDRAFRQLIFALFPFPRRLRLFVPVLWLYQRLGLRRSGLLDRLPARIRAMERMLPELTMGALRDDVPRRLPPRGPVQRRVGLLLGCIQRVFLSNINLATARVLAMEGCEVVVPQAQGCCGALPIHAGEEAGGLTLARRTIDVFERAGVDTIVVNAAGCGSTMKEYDYLLRHDPEYAERARSFVAKCKDVSEILTELEPRAPRQPLPLRVAYHDACHLQHAQGIRVQPRELLRAIPGVEVIEIPEAALCCGSAGIYSLVEPEASGELGDRKAGNVRSTGADVVVSTNPGCILQIASSLRRTGQPLPVLHLVELLDASIRGLAPAALRRR